MPFSVGYDDHIPQDFDNLPAMHQVMFRMLVGGFRHDRWLTGQPVSGLDSASTNLMKLQNGPICLIYELNRAEESVFITAIIRD